MDSVLGYKAGERAGTNGLDFVHQDDIQNAAEDLATLIQHPGSSIGKELRVKHHDGSWRTAELTATNLLDNPAVAGIVINFRDITERMKAQEALKQSEKRYRQLFESMQEGLWLIDKDSITTFVNPRMAEILGYTAEEMLGKHLFEFMDERGIEVAKYNLERRRQGIKEQHDFEFIRKDGARVYASLETSPITDEAGNYVGALACVADITERKRMEEEKQRMEEQLLLAGRLAAVGELSAGVAHELNNPIAAIQGFAQLLTGRNDLDETMKNDLGIIYREAQRAAKITQNLLSFARRHEPEKHLISLNEVIEKTLELRAHQMKVNNIEVVVEFATDLPKTTADFFQMQQVFVNIINNAEQAMVEAHRKGRLVVKTQKAGNMIQATFADDGPGISEDNLKRIFDPFFTTKEVGKGTGLGLSICYGIVEAHGGRIYARSKLGQGATVVVEIPIVAEGQ
jgi:two-component system NtrC family sensor kinase